LSKSGPQGSNYTTPAYKYLSTRIFRPRTSQTCTPHLHSNLTGVILITTLSSNYRATSCTYVYRSHYLRRCLEYAHNVLDLQSDRRQGPQQDHLRWFSLQEPHRGWQCVRGGLLHSRGVDHVWINFIRLQAVSFPFPPMTTSTY
jgi:hypothetical protein